jgi:hypothetical protein
VQQIYFIKNKSSMAQLIAGYKDVLLFKETVTHLYWLCELKRYMCYICRSSIIVILGCVQWQAPKCVRIPVISMIQHPQYNSRKLNNDVALLRLQFAPQINSEYISPVSLMLLCAVRPRVIAVQQCVSAHLSSRHP